MTSANIAQLYHTQPLPNNDPQLKDDLLPLFNFGFLLAAKTISAYVMTHSRHSSIMCSKDARSLTLTYIHRQILRILAFRPFLTMEHYAPHSGSKFEGYYSKFDLSSGSHIALIICSIPNASSRPHMVSFTYYPKSGKPIFQREHFVDNIEMVTTDQDTKAFELRIPGLGYMRTDGDGITSYDMKANDWSFEAQGSTYTAWRHDKSTPEGWMVRLPFPLHWHVHSLCSPCTFNLNIPSLGENFPPADHQGRATCHQEKNWAHSFPEAHMWVQAWDAHNNKGVCLAGGKIMGQTAYMLGYRSPTLNLDFIPPFSMSVFNIFSPFMSVEIDWPTRSFNLSVSNYFYKLDLKAQAPKEPGWFGLSCPFSDGFRTNFCRENFLATIEVNVSERSGWMPWSMWKHIKTETFEGGSLEFAGSYYPERGEKKE
jgi:tocopherol cyclase